LTQVLGTQPGVNFHPLKDDLFHDRAEIRSQLAGVDEGLAIALNGRDRDLAGDKGVEGGGEGIEIGRRGRRGPW